MAISQYDKTTRSRADVIVIAPSRGWKALDVHELWAYRELLWVLVSRDIKVRYKQTLLGCAWALIQPLVSMIIFSIVFGRWAKMPSDGVPYPVFVFAALLPWTFFAGAITASANSVVGSTNLITRVYFPRIIVPLASIGSGIIDFSISFLIMLALLWHYGIGWGAGLMLVPVLLLIVILTALGIGTLLAALNVSYRDFRYLIPFLLQTWMYATPVVYASSLVPDRWKWALYLNPMAGIIEAFRSVILGRSLDPSVFWVSGVVALLIFLLGVNYFEQVERRFADVI